MDYVDRTLKCVDCGNDFVFTAGEQLFFHDKQFKNDPSDARTARRSGPRVEVAHDRKREPPVRSAAPKPPYLSSRPRDAPSCAGSVFSREVL